MLAVGFAPAIGGNAMKTRCDGSHGIIDEALSSMAADCAGKFDPPDPRPLGVLQEDGPHEAEGARSG